MDDHEQRAPVIWLRQSARFTLGEQRRTVEIAIPVRPGATAEEIERLLREADDGMAALTRHLDGRIANLLGTASANGAPRALPSLPSDTGSPARSAAVPREDASAASERTTPSAAPSPARPVASPTSSDTASMPPDFTTPPPPSTSAERLVNGARPAPVAAPSASPPAASHSASQPIAAPASSAEPMTRPEFLAETRTLGLTPPQVMQRLGVRSLDGLNYREALELVRRQQLDEAGTTPAPSAHSAAPAASPSASSSAARPASPRAAGSSASPPLSVTRFDEEDDEADDYDITVSLPDDSDGPADHYDDDLDGTPERGALDSIGDLYDDGDEIPDVADSAPPPVASPAPSAAVPARARELLERFRGITPGSAGTPDQIKAYTNLIVGQLDATRAGTLVRAIWGVAPNRLGSDQLYELIRWGKEDAFAEEAPAVLALLAAERAKGSTADATGQAGSADRPSAPPARPTRPARASRASEPANGHAGGDA